MAKMYRVWVWVPTKRTVLLKTTRNAKVAYNLAKSLEPLEVFIEYRGNWYQGGSCCMPVPDGVKYNTIDEVLKTEKQ